MKTRRSWREKLEKGQAAKVEATPKGMMLVPRPLDVDALICKVASGKVATVAQIRDRLAREAGADYTCPLTTGIFLRMAAEASEEDRLSGKETVTPYWRVVQADGKLIDRFPGGPESQAARLVAEGVAVLPPGPGKPGKVAPLEQYLADM